MKLFRILAFCSCLLYISCDFLDVIPDDVATLDHAFADETTAERYLLTCYAGIPVENTSDLGPAFMGSDEFWAPEAILKEGFVYHDAYKLLLGYQNSNAPILNHYQTLYKTIRKCYIFQNNIDKVANLSPATKQRWIAESKCILSFCYYMLIRNYGPVPVIDKELSLNATPDEVRFARSSIDECVAFVEAKLNEAIPALPTKVFNPVEESGRFNKSMALAMKAKLLTMAASPLLNGNQYLADWMNKDGKMLMSAYSADKWAKALEACKEALDECKNADNMLYVYTAQGDVSPERLVDHTIRGCVTDERWSKELVWGDVQAASQSLQARGMPRLLSGTPLGMGGMTAVLNVPLKVVKQFYTDKGLPINEDPDWTDRNLTELTIPEERFGGYIDITDKQPAINLNREPRFYGALAFNRSKWYGSGMAGNDAYIVQFYKKECGNLGGYQAWWPCTGYMPKKLVNIRTEMTGGSGGTLTTIKYPFPRIRLADLYLLYAECENEVNGPTAEAKYYVDLVRERAGLKGVDESWALSVNPSKPTSREGFREIVHQERLIELSFEGHRYWDLRRWLKLERIGNEGISGWNTDGESAEDFYNEILRYTPQFGKKDYLWPISLDHLTKNPLLVQTKGW
ncbi:MAG: RagB/SusD family nutrient uptake outer membrane protein [Bacteroidales bacterium]